MSRAETIPELGRCAARADSRRRDENDCRCLCGSLVARRVPGGVELKCRRCKRCLVVALESETGEVAIEARP